jgi:phage gpG-like protein
MPATIQITIPPESQAIITNLRRFPNELAGALKRGMDKGANIALGAIARERFTGQGPFPVPEHRLGVRTNRLRSSLRWASAQSIVEGDNITVTGSMGSNVEYFGIHEFGFSGEVKVKSFTRKVPPVRFGRLPAGPHAKRPSTETVKAHTRRMNVPARAPLQTGLADHMQDFTDAIRVELDAALGRI